MKFLNVLTRNEMKSIMAGAARACNMCCWEGTNNCSSCNVWSSCSQGVLTPCNTSCHGNLE